jgi:methyl-accepting chemotaxis protein
MMSIRKRVWLTGAICGAAGAALGLAAIVAFGQRLGGPLALLVGVLAGVAGAGFAMGLFEDQLASFLSEGDDFDDAETTALGPCALAEQLRSMRRSLSELKRFQDESEAIERVTRSSWASIQGSGPRVNANARQCVTGLLDQLRQTAAQLVRHAAALEQANERVASGAVDQSETVSRTTTTFEALSEKIDRISQNAENANEACERTRQEARRGLDQVHRVIEGMDRLRAQIETNGRKARRLGDRSVEIGTIVELIRGISSRTDMLALNATIESVRAGEHGRGFAVVAEEIRKLAERTAAATCDIGTLVEAIQADAHESLRALGEEQSEMEQEVQRVRETGSALERISQVAEHSATLVDGITRSTNDQVLAAQDMVRAMQRISEVSHATLQGTNEARESLRGISQCCERLQPLTALEDPATGQREFEEVEAPGPNGRRKRHLVTSESRS